MKLKHVLVSATILGVLSLNGAYATKPSNASKKNPGALKASTRDIQARFSVRAAGGAEGTLTVTIVTRDGVERVVVTQAEPAGFWPFVQGDVIQKLNDRSITDPDQVIDVLRRGIGETVVVQVLRDGKPLAFDADPEHFKVLASVAPPEPSTPPGPETGEQTTTETSSRQEAESVLEVDTGEGVKASLTVTLVSKGKAMSVVVTQATPAEFWPFVQGDVVQTIDGHAITKPEEVIDVLQKGVGKTLAVQVLRAGKQLAFDAGPKQFKSLAPPAPSKPPTPPAPRPAPRLGRIGISI